jgi:hypothetical protein
VTDSTKSIKRRGLTGGKKKRDKKPQNDSGKKVELESENGDLLIDSTKGAETIINLEQGDVNIKGSDSEEQSLNNQVAPEVTKSSEQPENSSEEQNATHSDEIFSDDLNQGQLLFKKLRLDIEPSNDPWHILNDRFIHSLNSSIAYLGNNIRVVSILLLVIFGKLALWLIGAAVSALTSEDHSLERIQRAQKILSGYIEQSAKIVSEKSSLLQNG